MPFIPNSLQRISRKFLHMGVAETLLCSLLVLPGFDGIRRQNPGHAALLVCLYVPHWNGTMRAPFVSHRVSTEKEVDRKQSFSYHSAPLYDCPLAHSMPAHATLLIKPHRCCRP